MYGYDRILAQLLSRLIFSMAILRNGGITHPTGLLRLGLPKHKTGLHTISKKLLPVPFVVGIVKVRLNYKIRGAKPRNKRRSFANANVRRLATMSTD